ncbi:unnamed protein product [Bathycoccus prasinos]
MDDDDDDFNVKTWATLHDAALEVLSTPSAHKKALLTQVIAKKWFDGKSILKARDVSSSGKRVKETPERDALVTIVSSNSNKLKLGSGRSIESRRKILHSLSHIESWAIDLSWDIIARFGHEVEKEREFFDDSLEEIGGKYGDFPAHDGLWQSAMETSDSLMHRLVVEHCVHEARGLDVMPNTINKFRENGDEESALLLETIVYPEEIGHVKAGLKWFKFLLGDASERGGEETVKIFREIVEKKFYGGVETAV